MKPIHAVLVLSRQDKHTSMLCLCVYLRGIHVYVCYLWQACEDGGAAGGAAADRGEGVPEHQAALGQRAQVGSVDHRVVIHLCLKTCIISWRRNNTQGQLQMSGDKAKFDV